MKKSIILLICSLMLQPCEAREKEIKNPNFGGIPIVSLSYFSEISYEDAMNKYAKLKPDNYVMESVQYFKQGRSYIVKIKMRKI